MEFVEFVGLKRQSGVASPEAVGSQNQLNG